MRTSLFNGYRVNLIESVQEMWALKDKFALKIRVGIDTETTGLSYKSDKVVGVCVSGGTAYGKDHYQGYYIPVRHVGYSNNLPLAEVIKFVQWLIDTYHTCFFNRNFDASMLENEGVVIPLIGKMHDIQCMAHLVENESYPALKDYAENYLKFKTIQFDDNKAKNHDFGTTDPTVSYVYAAGDPLLTVLLGIKLWNEYPYIRKVYSIDNRATEAVRRLSKVNVNLDYEVVRKEYEKESRHLQEIKNKIFAFVGYQFNLDSTRDKADALCFSDDTEFLTEHGFKLYDEITDEKLMQVDPETLQGSLVNPEGRIERYAEKFYVINHRYTDIKVTEGHKLFINKGKGWELHPVEFVADSARGFSVLNTVEFEGFERTEDFIFETKGRRKKVLRFAADPFIEFLGFWLGDGHSTVSSYKKKDGTTHYTYKVGLTQSLCKTKEDTVKWLIDMNHRLGEPFTVSYREGRVDFQCACKGFALYMNTQWKLNGVKRVPFWVKNLSIRQRLLFLNAFLRADGTFNGVDVFLAWNKDLLEDLRMICAISGIKTSEIKIKASEGKVTSVKGIDLKSVSKTLYGFSAMRTFKYSHISSKNISIARGGRSVCFQVPSGVLVIRRNGKVSVCGNCRFVTLTKKTKAGKFQVDKETLSRIDHPLATMMLEYSAVAKYVGTYLKKLLTFEGNPVHINYSVCNVSTGRLSSGGAKGNDYYVPLNFQNIPKVEEKFFVKEDPILGQVVTTNEEEGLLDEEGNKVKVKAKAGLRAAFTPPEGYVVVCADYSSQELALMANFSRDPNLVNPMLAGMDIHAYVAKKMFGYFDPNHRTKVKILNFSVNYGAAAPTISRKLQIPIPEAQTLIDNYNATMSKLTAWKKEKILEGKRRGMVFTYFGRPRLVYRYFSSSDPQLRAFAERTCVNSPIQGCLPQSVMIETEHSVEVLGKSLGLRIKSLDGRVMVPSARGKNPIIHVQFETGDFILCDYNHQFITPSKEGPVVTRLATEEMRHNVVMMAPLKKKHLPSFKGFAKGSLSYIQLLLKNKFSIPDNDPRINGAFWKLAFSHKKFRLEEFEAASMRSLASLYGFNLVCLPTNKYQVKFTRSHLSKYATMWFTGKEDNVASCTVMQGPQMYASQGVMSKNTGGDLIRIDLYKIFKEFEQNEEFRENCIMFGTVHDEVDFYCKPKYLYKLYQKLTEIMTFQPSNFVVPIKISFAVGKNWGSCADVVEVTPDNKVRLI